MPQAVAVLFSRSLACAHVIRTAVPLPGGCHFVGSAQHAVTSDEFGVGFLARSPRWRLQAPRAREDSRVNAPFPKSSGLCSLWGRPHLGFSAPGWLQALRAEL